jgi:hypothetical protein
MPKTATDAYQVLDQQITEALAELRGARLDHEHCPQPMTVSAPSSTPSCDSTGSSTGDARQVGDAVGQEPAIC